MLVYSSDLPDRSEWQTEENYNYDLRNDLYAIHQELRNEQNLTLALFHAYERLSRYDGLRVSDHQNIAVQKLKARFYHAIGDTKSALTALDAGLFLAVQLPDNGAVVDLLSLRAAIHQSILRLRDAAGDIEYYLDLLHEEGDEDTLGDAAMALDGLVRLAGLRFYLGQYETAEQRLRDARRLLPLLPSDPTKSANIEWVQANLERWRGIPELALRHANAAAHVFSESLNLGTAARVQVLVADSALDFAKSFSGEGDSEYVIRLAFSHVQLARQFATEAADEIGLGMVQLAQARYSRICRLNENRVNTIESIARLARRRHDDALLAQAFTALADEMVFLGEREQGMNLYRDVLTLLHGSDVPALGVWARRPLLLASEFAG